MAQHAKVLLSGRAAGGGEFIARQRRSPRLQVLLQLGLGILVRDAGLEPREPRGVPPPHDAERRIGARIEADGAEQRLDRIGEYRIALASPARGFAGAQAQRGAQAELATDLGQRLAPHQADPQAVQLALAQRRVARIELGRDAEVQHRVAEELEAFVVAGAEARVRQRQFEQLAAREVVPDTGLQARDIGASVTRHRE